MRALLRPFLLAALLLWSAAAGAVDLGFDRLEQALKLRPDQKDQFDAAVGATQRALLSVALSGMQMKERFKEEMAKPRPDLNALARSQEDLIEQSRPLFREAREEWMKLYAVLDEAQVATAKAFVEERVGRLLR